MVEKLGRFAHRLFFFVSAHSSQISSLGTFLDWEDTWDDLATAFL